MAAPAIILVLVMQYLPMSGLVLAFKNYRYDMGVFRSPWNGLNNFRFLFASGTGWRITRNTILYNLLNLITSQLLAVIVAIFLTEIHRKYFKKVSQTVILLPYFISWVVVGVFVFSIFNYETGLINTIVKTAGGEPINFYRMPGAWPFIICAFNAWKWTGYNSVIYIAAITGIDGAINEAAAIDGATIFQRIRHITLPSIRPTLVTMILLQVGRILRGPSGTLHYPVRFARLPLHPAAVVAAAEGGPATLEFLGAAGRPCAFTVAALTLVKRAPLVELPDGFTLSCRVDLDGAKDGELLYEAEGALRITVRDARPNPAPFREIRPSSFV